MNRILPARPLLLAASFATASLVVANGSSSPQDLRTSGSQPSWWKGNLHTHTLNSDGDSTPDDVVRWYREHGYHFVTLTDHNYLTSVDGLNALHGADNGLDPASFIEPPGGSSVVEYGGPR